MPVFLRLVLCLLFVVFVSGLRAQDQHTLRKGRVIDTETRDPLAFVSIQYNDGQEGCISDIDGKFSIPADKKVYKLRVSYIGYEPAEITTDPNDNEIVIRLTRTAYELSEIIIKPGINPANRIIREVIANRYINDHEHLPSFTYTSYEKMLFGPESDSIPAIDSLAADSSYIRAKEFFAKQHLFIMESIAKRSFKFPAENYNRVIASRVSGLSDPLFVFLISQIQSTTFYKEVIKIADKEYINPISNGSLSKYYFELQDTLVEPFPYDTTFILSYRPLLNTNFDGLKGTLSISTNGYAIRNVIARPAKDEGLMTVKIQQAYDFVDSTHWFPIQLNTDIIISNTAIYIDSTQKTSLKMAGRGKSYISEIDLNPQLKRNQFGAIEVDVLPEAFSQPDELWNKYRKDTLNQREITTYHVIDSVGKANNLDKITRRLDALMNGKVTLGYVDLYLDYLFRVNHHEGFRAGLKLSTSDKISQWFRISGNAAYGFKDKEWKYGADAAIIFDRFRDFKITGGYSADVDEAGADIRYDQSRNLLNPEKFREIMVERMDMTRGVYLNLSSRLFKYLTFNAGINAYTREPLYDYAYELKTVDNISVSSSLFRFTDAVLNLRYAYGEKYIKNTRSAISLGTSYPILNLSLIHGFDNFLDGQYTYNRIDLKLSKSFFIKYIGTTTIVILAGYTDRDLPYVNLYNALSSYRSFTFYSPHSFATMRMDEFASDKYVNLFLSHNFGKLLFQSKHFKPEPELVTNIGFGSLRTAENHLHQSLKSYNKGYFESGLVINRILRLGITDIGAAWFYRYGNYALPTAKENMAWKISFQFVL